MAPAFSFSAYLLSLPVDFLYWWFVEGTFNLLKILRWILASFLHFLSINLLLKTFFQPWKNEYREGLVRFARFMGMFFKTMFLIFDVVFLAGLIVVEACILILWLVFPLLVLWGVYAFVFA